jgi:membrane glycosyltransferase
MFESLQQTGRGEGFDFFILSDSNDPNHWIKEEKSWLELCRQVQGFGRIFYRKRRVQLHHKSGNIADFCRRWGVNYRYMVVLDADSIMRGATLVRLVELMERNRSVGLIQTAPQMVLGNTLFRRVQQFAARLYGPIFMAGAPRPGP